MPDKCVPMPRCGWLNGTHPNVPGDVVTCEVCYTNSWFDCCGRRTEIEVKECSAGHHVYRLLKRHNCNGRYCGSAAGAGKFY